MPTSERGCHCRCLEVRDPAKKSKRKRKGVVIFRMTDEGYCRSRTCTQRTQVHWEPNWDTLYTKANAQTTRHRWRGQCYKQCPLEGSKKEPFASRCSYTETCQVTRQSTWPCKMHTFHPVPFFSGDKYRAAVASYYPSLDTTMAIDCCAIWLLHEESAWLTTASGRAANDPNYKQNLLLERF